MAQILHERLRGRLRLLLLVLRAAGFVFEHPDNPENLIEVTPETFESAMARTRQDYELSRGKQPNARMEGMSAKGGFHKNVMANNDSCCPNGKDMKNTSGPSLSTGAPTGAVARRAQPVKLATAS